MIETETPVVTPAPVSTPVHITDFDMPFSSIVGMLIKWTFAAIPALIILTIVAMVVSAFFAALIRL